MREEGNKREKVGRRWKKGGKRGRGKNQHPGIIYTPAL